MSKRFHCTVCGHESNTAVGSKEKGQLGCFILLLGFATLGVGWMLGNLLLAMPVHCEKCGARVE